MIFRLVVNETLAAMLFSPGLETLRDRLLCAYASQRYSMKRGRQYLAESVNCVRSRTDRNLLPHLLVVHFEATVRPCGNVAEAFVPTSTEHEYRRWVRADHPLVTKRLGGGYGIRHNTRLHRRVLEYRLDRYRLVIDPRAAEYYIQYKKAVTKKFVFRDSSLTLECLYMSLEGPQLKNPTFVRDWEDPERLLGVASFIDVTPLHIKTVYLEEKGGTVLYYRHQPTNHYHPFRYLVLEKEINDEDGHDDGQEDYYGWAAWRLAASLHDDGEETMTRRQHPDTTPRHSASPLNPESVAYRLPKLDGTNATLLFYDKHFIVTACAGGSTSHPHLLAPVMVHSLKDFTFIVETDLYRVDDSRYRPSAIIDIRTNRFDAEGRMDIIQKFRRRWRNELASYYIFFQGEEIDNDHPHEDDDRGSGGSSTVIKDGCIYEVTLGADKLVSRVIRERPDKRYANSRAAIREIMTELSSASFSSSSSV